MDATTQEKEITYSNALIMECYSSDRFDDANCDLAIIQITDELVALAERLIALCFSLCGSRTKRSLPLSMKTAPQSCFHSEVRWMRSTTHPSFNTRHDSWSTAYLSPLVSLYQ